MKHIDDGLVILNHLEAHPMTMRAYCLHPMLQDNATFRAAVLLGDYGSTLLSAASPTALALAVEYRNVANAYLVSHHKAQVQSSAAHVADGLPRLSPIEEVNDMLRADKIQNFHDFLDHHHGTHPDSDALHSYFMQWFKALDVDYDSVIAALPTTL